MIPVRARTTYNVQNAQNPPCLVIPVRARIMYIVQRTKSTVPRDMRLHNVFSASFVRCLHNVQHPPCFVQNVQNLLYLSRAPRTLRVLANQGVHDVRSAHCALCCVAK